MIPRPPRSTLDRSSAASDVYKRQAFNGGEVYLLPTRDAVDDLVAAHASDVAKDLVVGDESVPILWWEAPNPVRWAADGLTDLAGVPSLPTPSETYYEGGVSAEASASATFIAANAQAGVGVQGLLGFREGADGTSTTYYAATFDGSVSAGVRGGDGKGDIVHATAGASGELDGVIEIERERHRTTTRDRRTRAAIRAPTARGRARDRRHVRDLPRHVRTEAVPAGLATPAAFHQGPDFVTRMRAFTDAVHDAGPVAVFQLAHVTAMSGPSPVPTSGAHDLTPPALD